MIRDYTALVNVAAELNTYSGYLTNEDRVELGKIQAKFNQARNRFVYEAMQSGGDAGSLKKSISEEVDEMSMLQPGWSDTLAFVRDELHARIDKEARKSPLVRRIFRWLPASLVVMALLIYFGLRLFSSVEISQPLDSKTGLMQRANAAEKVIRYDDWMSANVRKGGWLKGLLLWPIEPTEQEILGAQEFAAVAIQGINELSNRGAICPSWSSDERQRLVQQVEVLGKVAAYVRNETTRWRQPPIFTVIDPIRKAFPCK